MTRMHNPPHPGEVLKDGVFTGTDISIVSFAARIGVTRVALSRVLNAKAAISPDMALRLADALGGGAQTWLHMQANYDLWQAEQKPRPSIERLNFQGA
jgi:addiction module HigA family antidote